MLSYKNTAEEIEKSGVDTAIIPIGSVEQHSTHLPVGTDYYLAKDMALLLPTLPISTCYEHKGKMGSVWMRPITLYQMIQDIVLSLHSQGIKKIAFIPGHGGIFVAPPAIRELNAMYDDLRVLWVTPVIEKRGILESEGMDIHSGESETSLMLYLHEQLVKKDLMMKNDCVPDCPQSYLNHASIHKLSTTGAWGKPSLATKGKGERLMKIYIEAMVEYIKDGFKTATKEKW